MGPEPGKSTAPDGYHCDLFIDENGDWFHAGNRITRPEILEALYAQMDLSEDGRFILTGDEGFCVPAVADTPFVVSRIDRIETEQGVERIELRLRHLPGSEALDPTTLEVGAANILYCRVRGGRFAARFSRPAYYQLAAFIEENPDSATFCIEINGTRYPISCSERGRNEES